MRTDQLESAHASSPLNGTDTHPQQSNQNCRVEMGATLASGIWPSSTCGVVSIGSPGSSQLEHLEGGDIVPVPETDLEIRESQPNRLKLGVI